MGIDLWFRCTFFYTILHCNFHCRLSRQAEHPHDSLIRCISSQGTCRLRKIWQLDQMIKIHHLQPPATNGGGSLIAWESCAATGHWGEHLRIQTGGWSVVGKIHLWGGWSDENIHDMTWDKMAMKGFVQEIQMITNVYLPFLWKLCGQDQLLWTWYQSPQKGPPHASENRETVDVWLTIPFQNSLICQRFGLGELSVGPFGSLGESWCFLPKITPPFPTVPTMLLPCQLKGAARFEDSFHRRGAQSTSQWGRMMGQRGWEKPLEKRRIPCFFSVPSSETNRL